LLVIGSCRLEMLLQRSTGLVGIPWSINFSSTHFPASWLWESPPPSGISNSGHGKLSFQGSKKKKSSPGKHSIKTQLEWKRQKVVLKLLALWVGLSLDVPSLKLNRHLMNNL